MRNFQTLEEIIKIKKSDLNEAQNYFVFLSTAFNEFQKRKFKSMISELQVDEHESDCDSSHHLIGFPGTIQNATDEISNGIFHFISSIDFEAKEFVNAISSNFIELIDYDKANIDKIYRLISENKKKIDQINLSFDALSTEYLSHSQKFANYTNEIRNATNKTAIMQYRRQFSDIAKIREDLAPTREKLLSTSQKALDSIRDDIITLSFNITEHNKKLKNLFLWAAQEYDILSSKMSEASNIMKNAADKINFSTDFKSFINAKKIIRYDLQETEFVPYDTNSPAFYDIPPLPKQEITTIMPIFMAKVVNDYFASGENEMNCKKGKMIYLLELPEGDWCYSMSPITRKTGFIPCFCVEPVGDKFGIVIRECEMTVEYCDKGDLIAIFDENSGVNYKAMNNLGEKFDIPKANVGIIFSNN
ncbi:hypothetical protein TRFO_21864 [Tritrichomonas foetus]|uniref:SH3 domain-containing protein n=1 Tax=Tritrichomonas foetus TaxID=1144522 RepID=A0A1J4KCZ0_9EUKA|nr:hypothetical protein TRFO_21864 [Tritrichomonas foetus]|eukprot:OHT09295.1 hypothetical protein TRFO_21864 [Tritrichomonas foetus]